MSLLCFLAGLVVMGNNWNWEWKDQKILIKSSTIFMIILLVYKALNFWTFPQTLASLHCNLISLWLQLHLYQKELWSPISLILLSAAAFQLSLAALVFLPCCTSLSLLLVSTLLRHSSMALDKSTVRWISEEMNRSSRLSNPFRSVNQ